jgi:hypothetical protein
MASGTMQRFANHTPLHQGHVLFIGSQDYMDYIVIGSMIQFTRS